MEMRLCELCGNEMESSPCGNCFLLSREDLINQAHKTLNGWKQLMIAAAISNGGQIILCPEQMLEAENRKMNIDFTPLQELRITIVK